MKDMKKMKGREFCNLSNKVIGCAIEVHKTLGSGLLESTYQQCLAHELRSVDLIIPESMAQDFGFTVVLGKQAHSRLRNYFSRAAVESKDKSDSGIIEFSFLSLDHLIKQQQLENNLQLLPIDVEHIYAL